MSEKLEKIENDGLWCFEREKSLEMGRGSWVYKIEEEDSRSL